ncbi:MAG: hypothetical protein BMS9Abin26_0105 [Gammaproteobacteria bacterium]|nr:MAG: hypothetical protein BMS9Abin26_0105 [Gammaproteobacteria bacterium]
MLSDNKAYRMLLNATLKYIKIKESLLLVLLMSFSSWAAALGLGDITVHSALGEPLKAEISVFASAAELDTNIKVKLASRKNYLRAGLQRASVLSYLRFSLVQTDEGKSIIKVVSRKPVNEPTISFIIEVDWGGGHLVRQYSAFLDPRK